MSLEFLFQRFLRVAFPSTCPASWSRLNQMWKLLSRLVIITSDLLARFNVSVCNCENGAFFIALQVRVRHVAVIDGSAEPWCEMPWQEFRKFPCIRVFNPHNPNFLSLGDLPLSKRTTTCNLRMSEVK